MPRAIQTFEVSLKAAVFREGRLLLVREADTGFWELPGGRIDVGEEWAAHNGVLAREIAEELGPAFRIELYAAAVTWVRQRPIDQVFQFIVARSARHLGGEPSLSDEHAELMWATPEIWCGLTFPPLSGYVEALRTIWEMGMRNGTSTSQSSM